MSSKVVPNYVLAAVLILVVLALAGISLPGHRTIPRETRLRLDRFHHLESIARVVDLYAEAHEDRLPQKLSDLVPDYYEDPKLLLFDAKDAHAPATADLLAHRELIDLLAPYSFLRLPDRRVLVFERPGFRNDDKMLYFLLGNDGNPVGNTSTCHVSPEEFMQRLDRGFPDLPWKPAFSYQNASATAIGAADYYLDVKGEELHTIHAAFLAGGKPPITPDAARSKIQAAMDRLDGPATWQVREGITASDGCTPYYQFRCDYLKDGQKTEGSVSCLVLFDGTVIAPTKQKRAETF